MALKAALSQVTTLEDAALREENIHWLTFFLSSDYIYLHTVQLNSYVVKAFSKCNVQYIDMID